MGLEIFIVSHLTMMLVFSILPFVSYVLLVQNDRFSLN